MNEERQIRLLSLLEQIADSLSDMQEDLNEIAETIAKLAADDEKS